MKSTKQSKSEEELDEEDTLTKETLARRRDRKLKDDITNMMVSLRLAASTGFLPLQLLKHARTLNPAFHDTDILTRILADTCDFLNSSGKLDGEVARHADILVRMSVSASWNAAFTEVVQKRRHLACDIFSMHISAVLHYHGEEWPTNSEIALQMLTRKLSRC